MNNWPHNTNNSNSQFPLYLRIYIDLNFNITLTPLATPYNTKCKYQEFTVQGLKTVK